MSTTSLPKDYESAMKVIGKFAKTIFAGSDENQKKDLHENLLVLAKLYTPSNMIKKRPYESDTNDTQVEKQAKVEHIEFEATKDNQVEPGILERDGKQSKVDSRKIIILPEEIWLKIMNYLKTKDLFLNFGLVNKFFNGLILDSRAVTYLELTNVNDGTKFNQVFEVIKRSKHLKAIQIESPKPNKQDCRETFWKHLMFQALKNSNLKSLRILLQDGWFAMGELALEDAHEIVRFGKSLEHLEIDKYVILDDGPLDEISKITTLKSLKIGYLSINSLIAIAKNCKQLENLSISEIFPPNEDDDVVREAFDTFLNERRDTLKKITNDFRRNGIRNLFQNINLCQNLEKLALSGHLPFFNLEGIIKVKGLKELVLWSWDSGKNNCVNFVIKSMDLSNLKSLVLHDKGDREGILFETISNIHFPMLERLYLESSGYSDKAVEALLRNCPNLKSAQLYISYFHIRNHKSISESISINTLVNYIKNGIYINFEDEIFRGESGTILEDFSDNLALKDTKLKEQDLPSWLKYQDLKRHFEEWRDANHFKNHERSNF